MATWLVEMTKRHMELSPSTSMNRGEAGSVKRRSRGRVMDSANAMVAYRIDNGGVRAEKIGSLV